VAGTLRLDLANFRELEAFAQLGTELDAVTQRQVDRGYRLVELLKQPQYQPVHVSDQVIAIYAATKGFLDDVPVNQVKAFETGLVTEIHDAHKEILAELNDKKELSAEMAKKLEAAIAEFKRRFMAKK
jgi:F-type H+/Na+-transporting ATPase subunit alpha